MNPMNLMDLKGNLIVSCQALETEPLHSSFIMGRMARAAVEGGAAGIRANSVSDIKEIKSNVDVPVIGIIKRDYPYSDVYITPTMDEIDELMSIQPEIIALDATTNTRPKGLTLDKFFEQIKKRYPDQLLMADCSTTEEMFHAHDLGFDFIGSTLVGYTKHSKHLHIDADDFKILRDVLEKLGKVNGKVIAEGNIDTPEKAKRVIELGCYSVVVGGAITRPQVIARKFSDALTSIYPFLHFHK